MPDPTDTVTIVEDDADLLDALRFSFEVEGFGVRTYSSAEALLADPEISGSGCLVVDYKLPGIDGMELLHRLRRRGLELPAVLITTLPTPVAKHAARANIPIVDKPLLGDDLFDTVRTLLRRPASPR